MLLAAGAKPLFACRQTGTSLDMIEKHYGEARVAAAQLDELIGEFKPPTGNLPGTLPTARDDPRPSKVKEPVVFHGVPTRAGDRGRTGDVQLGKLSRPLWRKGFSAAVAETGTQFSPRCACPRLPSTGVVTFWRIRLGSIRPLV
jgi:hypothetical protein